MRIEFHAVGTHARASKNPVTSRKHSLKQKKPVTPSGAHFICMKQSLSTKLPPLPGLFHLIQKKPNVFCSSPIIRRFFLGAFEINYVFVLAPGAGR